MSKTKKNPWPLYVVAGLGVAAAAAVALVFILPPSPAENTRTTSNQAAAADSASRPELKSAAKPESKSQPVPWAKAETKVDCPPVAVAPATSKTEPPKMKPSKPEPSQTAAAGNKPKVELAADVGSDNEPNPQSTKHAGSTRAETPPPSEPKPVAMTDATAETKSAKPKRAAPPDKPSQQAAEAKVREIYQEKFAEAKTGKAHTALAKKLLEDADGTKDDAAAHYVLLKMAGREAVLGGDVAQAMEVVDKMQADYQIDAANMKAVVLADIVRQPSAEKTADSAICDMAMKLCDEAMACDDFELAGRFATSAATASRRSRDTEQNRLILARIKEIDRLKGRFAAVQKALDTLESDAADGGANLIAGQWYCFTKGDWGKGLPMLAKGNREDLLDPAKRDLAKPTAAKDQAALGDAWWALSEKEAAPNKAAFESRARHWYEQALPQLTGLDKMRAEKRMEQAAAARRRARIER